MPKTNPAGTNEEEEVVLQQPILHLHHHIRQVTQLWRRLHQATLLQRHLQHHHQQIAIKSHLWATSTSRKRIVFCSHHLHQVSHRNQLLLQLLHQLLLRLLHQPPHWPLHQLQHQRLHLQHHLWQGVVSPTKIALPLTLSARSGTSASVPLTSQEGKVAGEDI